MDRYKLKKLLMMLGMVLLMVIRVFCQAQLVEKVKRDTIDLARKSVNAGSKTVQDMQIDYQALNKDLFGQNSPHWFEIKLFSESVKGEFTEVQKENSMFPEGLISEFENMIYQSFDDSLQKYTWEEVQKSSYFEITDKFGANDFRPDIEEMKNLFPELEDAKTRMEAYKRLYGSENCIDMFRFHIDKNQDNYLFVADSGGSAGIVNIWLTKFEQEKFVTICEFPVENSGYGSVIQYDENFYYVFVAKNYNLKNYDGIHIHKLGANAREENLVIKYLPTEYVWKNVYMGAEGEELSTYLESIKDEITSDKYLENGKEKDIEVYYGDEASLVQDNDGELYFEGYNKIDFLNIGNPIYIQKSNHIPRNTNSMWFLRCNFKIQDLENDTMLELENMRIGEYIPSASEPILVQLWFKKSKDKVYTFCLYHVCDYNYVLNVLLIEGDKVSRIRTDIISPQREFVLTEGEVFYDM